MPNALTRLRGALAIGGAVALTVCGPRGVRETTVSAVDYAFRFPDTLSAGPIVFHLRNDGKVRHEMILTELKRGVRPESAYAVEQRNGDVRTMYERDAALLTAGPGELPSLGLRADLEAGRTYVLLCTFSDGPGKPPHLMLGMYKPFTVR